MIAAIKVRTMCVTLSTDLQGRHGVVISNVGLDSARAAHTDGTRHNSRLGGTLAGVWVDRCGLCGRGIRLYPLRTAYPRILDRQLEVAMGVIASWSTHFSLGFD